MKAVKVVIVILFVLVVASAISFISLLSPKDASATTTQSFEVKAGTSRSDLSNQLAQAGLIKSSFAFYLYGKVTRAKILPGPYKFSPSQSASDIAGMLSAGEFETDKITLIEGWRATDIENYLVNEKHLKQMTGFADQASQYEGYLFPDTYEIKSDTTIAELITLLRDNYKKKTADLTVTPDVLTLASIVEREAADDSQRATIAGVYTNRLKIGMKLEADPTVQYAKGNWKVVSISDYHSVISPYNTYLNDGLPPGPICNPGLKSIEAALHPEQNDYIYFFQAKGQIYLSKTLAEHQAKVRQVLQ